MTTAVVLPCFLMMSSSGWQAVGWQPSKSRNLLAPNYGSQPAPDTRSRIPTSLVKSVINRKNDGFKSNVFDHPPSAKSGHGIFKSPSDLLFRLWFHLTSCDFVSLSGETYDITGPFDHAKREDEKLSVSLKQFLHGMKN